MEQRVENWYNKVSNGTKTLEEFAEYLDQTKIFEMTLGGWTKLQAVLTGLVFANSGKGYLYDLDFTMENGLQCCKLLISKREKYKVKAEGVYTFQVKIV